MGDSGWRGSAQERQLTSEEITPLTEVERDALCELANVAMSRAATSLRQMVRRPILLSAPTCEILAPETAVERLTKPGNPDLVAVRQDFTGAFSGRALLIFPERGSLELMRAILGRQLAAHDILDRQCHSQQLVDNARQYTEKEPQDVAAGGDP